MSFFSVERNNGHFFFHFIFADFTQCDFYNRCPLSMVYMYYSHYKQIPFTLLDSNLCGKGLVSETDRCFPVNLITSSAHKIVKHKFNMCLISFLDTRYYKVNLWNEFAFVKITDQKIFSAIATNSFMKLFVSYRNQSIDSLSKSMD